MTVRLAQRNDRDDEDSNAESCEQETGYASGSSPPRREGSDVDHRGEIIRRSRAVALNVDAGDSPAICAVA
jgi:hypothetical protein